MCLRKLVLYPSPHIFFLVSFAITGSLYQMSNHNFQSNLKNITSFDLSKIFDTS